MRLSGFGCRSQRLQLGRRHRAGEEVALDLVAAPLGRAASQRLRAVDALGDDAQAEPAAEVDERVHDRGVALVAGDAA